MTLPRTIPSRLSAALLIGASLLAGCMNDISTVPNAMVRVAQQNEVGNCRYITNIDDTPGMYGVLATQGQDYARKAILDDAAQAGANTVVFDKIEPGSMVTKLRATAYRC